MAFDQNLCDNYIDIEFSTSLEVKSWMNVKLIERDALNNINLIIAVNTDNIKVYKEAQPYGSSVEVPDPCDPTSTILVDNIMLNVAKIKGYIGYYVGAEVLDGNPDILFENNSNPIALSNYVTAGDICFINDENFLVLEPDEEAPTDLLVTVMEADLDSVLINDSDDYVFHISGKFRVTKKPVVTP